MILRLQARALLRRLSCLPLLALSACLLPTAKIEPEIKDFKKNHSENIIRYRGVHREMGAAWSGNPKKRPLIFIHGSPGSWQDWAEFLMNPDLQAHYQIIAVDRPGYGNSGLGRTERSLQRQAEDIAAVLKINQSGLRPILVGHSYGGPVVAAMAVFTEVRPEGLVFVAASVDPALEETKWYQIPASWWPIRSLIPTVLRVCNEEILALKRQLEELKPLWPKIHAKIAIIQGDADTLVPAANREFILKQVRTDQIVEDSRSEEWNHFIPWEHPELIVRAIKKVETAATL